MDLSRSAFSGYSIDDVDACRTFYRDTLGLDVSDEMGGLVLRWPNGHAVFVYPKPDHRPATFTVLNLPVGDIDEAVDALTARGVEFLRYDGLGQDEKGVSRPDDPSYGPQIAWFTDPAGNIISVLVDDEA
jgi:catechol 2,3-dioxygenase-like lactoylglutathione lyase family enzyme